MKLLNGYGSRASMAKKAGLETGLIERLEDRCLLAAHVIGSPVVYSTIQTAVTAAPTGGTVVVDSGTYPELVTINKALTLRGARGGIDGQNLLRALFKGESVVTGGDLGGGNRTTAFYITANDVTIDGFTARDNASANLYGAGIVIAPSVSGTHIYNNIIQHNVAGLYLSSASATDPTIIQHNLFAFNNNPGNNNGRGIYTDGGVSGGNLTNVVIDANAFVGNVGDGTSGNPEAAIGLEAQTAGKQSNISITNNLMIGNGKGVLMYNVTGATIKGNIIAGCTDATSAAIRVEGNVTGLTISNNSIFGNSGAAFQITDRFVGPSSNITLSGNNIFANKAGGLIVDVASYTGTLDARNNWWGAFTGPSGDGHGSGNSVVSNGATVLYTAYSPLPKLQIQQAIAKCAPAKCSPRNVSNSNCKA